MTTKLLALAIASSVVIPCVSSAAVVPADEQKTTVSIKKEASEFLKSGAFEEACNLLDTSNDAIYDLQLTFLKAQCSFGIFDYSAAVFHYQLMLEKNTNLPRVRTELARTLAAMGKNRVAKQEYERVLLGDLPPMVRRNIEAQVSAIDEQRRFHGVYSLGFMHDSNINAAPSDPTIQAFGLPFVLNPDSTERSDTGLQGSISAGTYFDGPFGDSWRFDAYGNFLKYETNGDFDSQSVGVSAGPNFYSNYQLYLPVGVSASWEGGQTASQVFSFTPSLSRSMSRKLRFNGGLNFQYYDDKREADESNGWSTGVSANMQYSVNQSQTIEFGASILNNDANDVSYNRSISKSLSAGWHTVVMNAARFSLQGNLSTIVYDATDPVDMGIVREDDRIGVNLSLYKDVTVGSTSFTPVLSLGWTKNDSNIDRRDYERKTISLQLRKQF